MLIYIHGFNSSALSGKARELGAWMAARGLGEAYACPNLPHRPAAAIALLEALIAQARGIPKLVGSSLGGYYAAWLAERHELKAVLVNPAIGAHRLLADEVGKIQQNWHGDTRYEFTGTHLEELSALHVPRPAHAQRLMLLVETGDEVLDYRAAVDYCRGGTQIVLPGGDHGFSRFAEYIPAILAF